MTYITGAVTSADPGPALYAAMEPSLIAAGLILVDTVVITVRTHKVWKSPAASNAQNLDWYLDIGYTTTGAATIFFQPFEFYDPATDLGYRGPYTAINTAIDATTGSRYGASGYALQTNWMGGAVASFRTSLPVTEFSYWLSITCDRVIMMISSEPGYLSYTGFYSPDPLYAAKAGAKLYPLIQSKMTGNSDSASHSTTPTAAVTRVAPATAITGWEDSVKVGSSAILDPFPLIPSGVLTSYPAAAAPIGVTSVVTKAPYAVYGTLRDTARTRTAATVVRGDTVSIGADAWVLTSSAGDCSLLFKAA